MLRSTSPRWLLLPFVVAFAGTAASCSDEAVPAAGKHPAATTTSADGGGGATGTGGTGGVEPPSRGDPAEFPQGASCIETCNDACAHVAECHGDESPIFPITQEECELRCTAATKGPVWDDVSGNFRCCASQEACSDVQHCGGWLAHPAPIASCEKLCKCFFSQAVRVLTAGRTAPAGYRFAPDVVMLRPDASLAGAALPGVRSIDTSTSPTAPVVVHLDNESDAATLTALEALGTVLPTFVDAAGRVVAATGRIVVVARDEATRSRVAKTVATLGGARARALAAKHGEAVEHVRVVELDAWDALGAAETFAAVGGVESVELDMIRPYDMRHIPDDPLFANQWHLKNDGGAATAVGVDGRVSEAWDATMGDAQVVVALNDDGVDLDHQDFAGKLAPALNFPDDWKAQMQAGQFGGHGTSCAGVATANADDAYGSAGVCPKCTLLPHLLGPSAGGQFQISDVDIAEGFTQQVDAGAWVISNSWGPSTGNPVYEEATFQLPANPPAVIKTAYDYAETTGRGGKGTVILFAAGNSNDVLDYNGTYTTNLAVAAVGDVGLKAYYSSFGPKMGIAAPSNGAIRGITTTAANGQHTDSFGGTSSACPFAAGVVGLIFSANPALTAAEARTILKASARRIDPVWGEWTAEGSPFYGAGLVDSYVAVQMATGACADPATCPAPSDDCGASCGTVAACGVCRTDADCAAGSVCQALPSVGALVCVQAKTGACPAGTNEVNGYCVPTAATCGFCPGTETCNGNDEDCDGLVDEEGCANSPRCFADADGCGPGKTCAATSCATTCTDDSECTAPATCVKIKTQYGEVTGTRACIASQSSQCQIGCEILASSLDDAKLADFVDCMKDGATSCGSAFACAQKLPVNF